MNKEEKETLKKNVEKVVAGRVTPPQENYSEPKNFQFSENSLGEIEAIAEKEWVTEGMPNVKPPGKQGSQ